MSEIQRTQKRSFFARILFSPDEPRLRAGWRLLIQTILLAVVLLIGLLGVPKEVANSTLGNTIILFIAVTGSVYIARRWLDKRSFKSLGLELDKHTLFDVLAGIGIVGVQMGFIFVVLLSLGWLTFEGFAWQVDSAGVIVRNVLMFFVAYILIGWQEELLSRAVITCKPSPVEPTCFGASSFPLPFLDCFTL